jgi:hypothetical protein
MPKNIPKLNNYGYPYLPIPTEFVAALETIESPNLLNDAIEYEEYLRVCTEYESLYGWLEAYHYEQYGPPPPDEEFDPDRVNELFERFEVLAKRIYAIEKAPHLVAATLARSTPKDASNEIWALYAIDTDPVSINGIDGSGNGYPLLLRQLALTGDPESKLLIYAPTWFPLWLCDQHVRRPYVQFDTCRPTPTELEIHSGALSLWAPNSPSHVFHDYFKAYSAAKKTWQRVSDPI